MRDSGCVVLNGQPVGLPDGLDIGCERRRKTGAYSKVRQAASDTAPYEPRLLVVMSLCNSVPLESGLDLVTCF